MFGEIETACINCKGISFIPSYEEWWTCYGCGRMQRLVKANHPEACRAAQEKAAYLKADKAFDVREMGCQCCEQAGGGWYDE